MAQALKQAWWAPPAGLLVVPLLAVAATLAIGDEDAESKIVGIALALAGAVATAAGLRKRPRARGLGNGLAAVGALLAAFWFWTLLLPILAIIVVFGIASSEVRSRTRPTQAP